jgi:hypothetical protein
MPVELHVIGTGCVLSLATTDELTLLVGDGVLDPELRVRGSIDALNAALDGSTLTPDRDFDGNATLMISVDDLGHTGAGGAQTGMATLSVAVIPVDDLPTAANDEVSVLLGDPPTTIDVLANDSSGDVTQKAVVVSVTTPEQGSAAVNADGSAIVYTLDERFVGDDHFDYTMSDGVTQATASVTVHVVAPPAPMGTHLVGGGLGCGMTPRASGVPAVMIVFVLFVLSRRRRSA